MWTIANHQTKTHFSIKTIETGSVSGGWLGLMRALFVEKKICIAVGRLNQQQWWWCFTGCRVFLVLNFYCIYSLPLSRNGIKYFLVNQDTWIDSFEQIKCSIFGAKGDELDGCRRSEIRRVRGNWVECSRGSPIEFSKCISSFIIIWMNRVKALNAAKISFWFDKIHLMKYRMKFHSCNNMLRWNNNIRCIYSVLVWMDFFCTQLSFLTPPYLVLSPSFVTFFFCSSVSKHSNHFYPHFHRILLHSFLFSS